jgi:ribosomal protein S18 acetylase RimI-like enzyme
VPALARLGARLARAHHAMDRERFFAPEEPLEEGYAWWLGRERRNPRAAVLAAVRRGRVVGYAYGRVEPRDWSTLRDRCGVGIDLWVEPAARRAGIAAALVDALGAALAARGAPRLVVDVAARNERARAAFARLGFRETMVELTRELPAAPRGRRGRAGA